jgi:hypothetical protein
MRNESTFFVPVLFTSAALIFLGKPLLAQRITYGTGFLVYFWLTMDIQTQSVTGQNIVEYFQYILPNGAEWAGGMGWIINHFALTAAWTFLAIVISVIATQVVINIWSRIATPAMSLGPAL